MNPNIYRDRLYKKYIETQPALSVSDMGTVLRNRATYLRHLVKNHFPLNQDASILDLGCGFGAILFFAQEAGYKNILGIDVSPQQVEAADRLGIKGVTEDNLFIGLSKVEDVSQDCIITFDVIEHFTKDELMILVDEVFRTLKPGGRWIIHTVNGESPFATRVLFHDFTHEMAFTHRSLSQLLLASQFQQVKSFEDEPIVHNLKSTVRWILWKIIRSALHMYLVVETGDVRNSAFFSQNILTVAIK